MLVLTKVTCPRDPSYKVLEDFQLTLRGIDFVFEAASVFQLQAKR